MNNPAHTIRSGTRFRTDISSIVSIRRRLSTIKLFKNMQKIVLDEVWNRSYFIDLFQRRSSKLIFKFMRITLLQATIAMTLCGVGLARDNYGQDILDKEVSLKYDNVTLEEALSGISKQVSVKFAYSGSLVNLDDRITVKVSGKRLGEVLKELLTPRQIAYAVRTDYIVLTQHRERSSGVSDERTLPWIVDQNPGIISVSGRVTDASTFETLPGATIIEKGTSNGTTTDADGRYQINCDEAATLVVSFVGYQSQEILVNGRTAIDIQVVRDFEQLDEVVVVGYGTQKKVNLTGAVDQVTADQLETRSVANVGQALQGVVPNLNITFSDGNPVKDPSFNIRGGTSFSGGSFKSGSPLILVDGVPMEINNLNPTDIESISVLKDAASAAIYGARAAYGVILVTTKKGNRNSAPKISFSSSYQIQQPINKPNMINSVEYQEALINAQILEGGTASSDDIFKLERVREYFENPGTAPSYYVAGGTNIWVANVDPWDEFLKDSAPLKNHFLSISGGSANSNYYASVGFRDQEGLVALGDDYRKTYNATVGLSTDVNKWLNLSTNLLYTRSDAKRPHGQGGYSAYSDGYFEFLSRIGWRNLMSPRFTPESSPVGVMPTHSSLNAFLYDGNITTQNSNLLMKIEANVKLMEGLSFKTNYAFRTIDENQKMFLPLVERIEKSWEPFVEGFSTMSRTFSASNYSVLNAYFDFYKTVNSKHDFSAVAGFNQEVSKHRSLTAQGNDLVTDAVPALKLSTGAQSFSDNESHWSIRGAFVRLNYIFDDRYLFEMNGRYDGTSKFRQGSRFKFFPSFSAGWRISEESFMEDLKTTVSNLKVRASYGSLGNQDVANYAYIASYGLIPQVAYLMNGERPIGITSPGLVSSDLTWETATTIDFGADITLLDKLTATFDWYKRTTSDILTTAEKLPSVLGTGVPNQNTGVMETKGWELSTSWRDALRNGLQYDVSLVLSDTRSEVVEFLGNPEKIISSLYEGKQMGEIWGLQTQGIFQTAEEISDAASQQQIDGGVWRPGDVRYADLSDDKQITRGNNTVGNPGDQKIIGNSMPRYQFGVNANVAWKNFDFNMFWQGTGKRDYWSGSYLYWGLIRGTNIHGGIGTPEVYYDSWTPERTDAFFPAFKPALKNMQVQSRYLLNASFLRLKNVTLGYTLPMHITERIHFSKVRVYASGFNLATFSKVPDFMDPENMDDAYPLLRSYTMGFQVTF